MWTQEDPTDPKIAQTFLGMLRPAGDPSRLGLLRKLMVRLVVEHGYDSRLRTCFRGLAGSMQVEWGEIGDLERALGAYLAQKLDVLKAQMRDRKFSRYAKTAGAAVVGGTLMALTAASAAPVIGIIAGSGIWGASTVAGLLSLGTLHAIFGVAGAGLVGHKMRRRTKGLQEFEFVEGGGGQNGRGMALTICISGWVQDVADFKRPWGVALTRKDIPLLERLRRFFIVQDAPDRYNAGLKSELSKFKIQCMRGGKSGPQSGVSSAPCECQCKAQLLEMGFAEDAVDQVLVKTLKR